MWSARVKSASLLNTPSSSRRVVPRPRGFRGRKLRRWVNRIHLWAAVIGSVPALLLCLTGLILVFESELQAFEERAYTSVTSIGEPLGIAELVHRVETAVGEPATYLALPPSPESAALLRTADRTYHFVNPYNGEILNSDKRPAIIMGAVRVFHTSFFAGEFGTWVGVVSSCFLVALCGTGCFLFLKRRLQLSSFYRVRWSPINRRHYDLHAVVGFATAIPIALIALSGALIGLGATWQDLIKYLTNTEFMKRPVLESGVDRSDWDFDYAEVMARVEATAPKGMFIHSIIYPSAPKRPIYFRLLYDWAQRPASWAFVDPRNGEVMEFHHHWDYPSGHLIHRLNRGFHSGELYGNIMRWIWFALMVVPFVLAYTGYRQWRPKRHKPKPKLNKT